MAYYGLLYLMTADVHHMNDGEFMGEMTLNASASGSMGSHAIISGLHNFPTVVVLYFYIFWFVKLINRILTSMILYFSQNIANFAL